MGYDDLVVSKLEELSDAIALWWNDTYGQQTTADQWVWAAESILDRGPAT